MTTGVVEVRPMGDRAVLVCGMVDPAAWSLAITQGAEALLPGTWWTVPAAETVLVVCASPATLAAVMPMIRAVDPGATLPPAVGEPVTIPVVYDGADLADVAHACGMTEAEAVAAHSGAVYTVAFCGFAPGFAYLAGLPPALHVPRRATPRTEVAAGSVAIASEFTAVYPRPSPGGWNLLGTTSMNMFGSAPVLKPGDRVRFAPVERLSPPIVDARHEAEATLEAAEPAFSVVDPGVRGTIQDAGRVGRLDLGIPPSGMVDPALGMLMNRVVGNAEDAPLIETCGGLEIRAARALVVASTEMLSPKFLAPGESLVVRGGAGRRWHYLAVRGGVVAAKDFGSSSTDTLSGLGPAPLAAGDRFAVGDDPASPMADATPMTELRSTIRVSRGPRLDWFAEDTFDLLSRADLVITHVSRVGVRLAGLQLTRVRQHELPSEGLVRGAIQVPPSGELLMMLADHPTTGGYPVVAVVHPDDVHRVAQLPNVSCTPF